MSGFNSRSIILAGCIIVIIGCALFFVEKGWLKKLPGDIHVQRGQFTFYFPLATSLIVSAILTLLINLFSKK